MSSILPIKTYGQTVEVDVFTATDPTSQRHRPQLYYDSAMTKPVLELPLLIGADTTFYTSATGTYRVSVRFAGHELHGDTSGWGPDQPATVTLSSGTSAVDLIPTAFQGLLDNDSGSGAYGSPTAAGQLLAAAGNGMTEWLAKGTAGQVLTVGGTDGSGLEWAPPSGGASLSTVPNWAANTSYAQGAEVLSPSGGFTAGVVSYCRAKAAFTSGASFTASNWEQIADILPGTPATLASTAPGAPAPTGAAGTAATAMRSDAVTPSSGMYRDWGDGFMGNMTFDGTTGVTIPALGPIATNSSTLTPTSNVYTLTTDIYANNLTVNSGVTIKLNGYRIFCLGLLTNNGHISADGNSATSATGAAGAPAGSMPGSSTGGSGATGAGGAAGSTSTFTDPGLGGSGGAGSSGAGGNHSGQRIGSYGGLAASLHSAFTMFYGFVTSPWGHNAANNVFSLVGGGSGGGGGGDGTNPGGGAGTGGGVGLVNARRLAGAGSFTANGGNGFTPTTTTGGCGGGGAGAGGYFLVNTMDKSGWSGTMSANAGTPGSGVGTGATGGTADPGWTNLTVWS